MTQEDVSTSLRLRVGRLMGCATLEPSRLPPSAILLVRRLNDPCPRGFLQNPYAIRPEREWERAAQSSLEALFWRAARPGLGGPIPDSCDSVFFADTSEMLACLARDFLGGRRSSWWWLLIARTLCRGSLHAWTAAWHQNPRYIPGALRTLSEQRAASTVVASLSSSEAAILLSAVAREFELDLLPPSDHGNREIEPAREQSEETEWHNRAFDPSALAFPKEFATVPAPWASVIPSAAVSSTLGTEQAALLGVSLVLQSAPALARSRRFSHAFKSWFIAAQQRTVRKLNRERIQTVHRVRPHQGISPEPGIIAETSYRTTPPPQLPFRAGEGSTSTGASSSLEQSMVPAPQTLPPVDTPEAQRLDSIRPFPENPSDLNGQLREANVERIVPAPASDTNDSLNAPASGYVLEGVTASPSATHLEMYAEQPVTPLNEPTSPGLEPIPTELGGVLFLINLMRALRLPECLESEFGVEAINGWTLLALIARCLLRDEKEELSRDAIWLVLADLSGRRGEKIIGEEFAGKSRYSLPASWLSAFDFEEPIDLGVRVRKDRLQLWHASGFLLLDRILDGPPNPGLLQSEFTAVEKACRISAHVNWRRVHRNAARGCFPGLGNVNPALQRFLGFLMPYVRQRLVLALGAVPSKVDLVAELLFRRGHLYVTGSHVDLVMNLDQATGAVRLSGLDADPGWVPELGRVVKFTFTPGSAL